MSGEEKLDNENITGTFSTDSKINVEAFTKLQKEVLSLSEAMDDFKKSRFDIITILAVFGVTLAGILLFGKDYTILSVLPHFKTDAILRRDNVDRYDDRDDVRTNLIESYDRLLHFGEKHLNDPFYLEGD